MKSLYVLPNSARVSARRLSIDLEGWCQPEQLASVGLPPRWRPASRIFLLAGVGLERDVMVLFGELKFAWFVSTTGARWKGYGWWLWLLLSGHPWWVRAMPVAPQQGFQPALSVTILAGHTAGNCSLVGPGLAISLRNRLGKSSSIWQPANLSPTLTTTHPLYCKSLQY